jgi:hypothetical protein
MTQSWFAKVFGCSDCVPFLLWKGAPTQRKLYGRTLPGSATLPLGLSPPYNPRLGFRADYLALHAGGNEGSHAGDRPGRDLESLLIRGLLLPRPLYHPRIYIYTHLCRLLSSPFGFALSHAKTLGAKTQRGRATACVPVTKRLCAVSLNERPLNSLAS